MRITKNLIFLILLGAFASCKAEEKNNARFQYLANLTAQGNMEALVAIQEEFPDYWKKMQNKISQDKADEIKAESVSREKVKNINMLLGFDLSLTFDQFKEKYKEEFPNCKVEHQYLGNESFLSDMCMGASGNGYTHVDFAGLNGTAKIIRNFQIGKRDDKILGADFIKKLQEKTGLIIEYSEQTDNVHIPFYKGNLDVTFRNSDSLGNKIVDVISYNHLEDMKTLHEIWEKEQKNKELEKSKANSNKLEL